MNDMIELGQLWENESKAGRTYLAGYLGKARILIFHDPDVPSGNERVRNRSIAR